jgi:hypothetical protein
MSVWLLCDRFTLDVSRLPDDVLDRLRRRVAGATDDLFLNEDAATEEPLFTGVIQHDRLVLWRLAGYYSAFQPVIRGQVLPAPEGSSVTINLRVNGGGLVASTVWFVLVTGMSVASLLQMEPGKRAQSWPMVLIGLAMLLVPVYLVAVWTVWYERRRTRAILVEVLAS